MVTTSKPVELGTWNRCGHSS